MLSFLHIPKAGGSTLRWVLDRQYRPLEYLTDPWFTGESKTPLSVAAGSRACAIAAHRCRDDGWPAGRMIALVREPVRRVLSHLAHIRAEPDVWLPPASRLKAQTLVSVSDWLSNHPLALFDNNQVRYFSGCPEFDGMPVTRRMDETDLAIAIEAVRADVWAAPIERFDEALIDWAHRLHWQTPVYRRVNVRQAGQPPPSAEDVELLEQWNELDRKLCREVEIVFDERLRDVERQTGRSMAELLDDFRRRNDSVRARFRIARHTASRGVRHPVRAGRMVLRTIRQRLKTS